MPAWRFRARVLPVAAGAMLSMASAFPAAAAHAAGSTASPRDCPKALSGAWRGSLPVGELFRVKLTITRDASGAYAAAISSSRGTETAEVWPVGKRVHFQSAKRPLAFTGAVSADGSRIDGFVYFGRDLYRVKLPAAGGAGTSSWSLDWSPLDVGDENVRLDLYVGNDGHGGLGGYFFFRDQRLPGLWGEEVVCRAGAVTLGERNLGLRFEGRLDGKHNTLSTTVTGAGISAPVTFERMSDSDAPSVPDSPEAPPRPRSPGRAKGAPAYVDHAPDSLGDGWQTAKPSEEGIDPFSISRMVRAIVSHDLDLTHAVLVARHGRLVVEEYFYGFDRDALHDMRSASKTITSMLVGLAIQKGEIPGVSAPALSFFPDYRRYENWDPRKARITIKDLLIMASGLDANDADPNSVASENAYQGQVASPDWIKLALDAPMIGDPGRQPIYGSANPLILGGVLAKTLDEPVEWFADRALFAPLGTDHYTFFTDPTGIPYMAGGVWMRPRDMAKLGQLYLDGGVWRGKRVVSEAWVKESWGTYGTLGPLKVNGNPYGYLWWHARYDAGGRSVETLEARGHGGQYIIVAPALDLVAVITSGNYHTGKTRQPEKIFRDYILPAVRRP